jgi:hypothetical protein
MNRTEEANSEKHYILIVVSIFVILFGIYFRFACPEGSGHPFVYNCIANIIVISGVILALKAIFAILK